MLKQQGWKGWDDYADFYDWENAQTLDRRDVKFWQDMADARERARPRARLRHRPRHDSGRAHRRPRRRRRSIDRDARVRAPKRSRRDALSIRARHGCAATSGSLPFRNAARFDLVMAPYGILQSLVRESDLKATLASVARVLARGGLFGVDLVPDLPVWKEYRNKVRFRGSRRGGKSRITLVESVRQDRAKKLTIFDQEYIERRGRERQVAPVFAGVPHAHGAADDQAPRARGVPDSSRSGRLQRTALGSARRRVADPRGEVLEFRHVWPFKMGVNQA